MGNYVSCTLIVPTIKSSKASRVIFPSGEVRQFREPVKAAELMLESPNFFLVNSKSLHMGRRFSPLAADEDLEFGNLYVLFPMKRVNSVITAADMAVYLLAANSAPKRITGGKVRILPESGSAAAARGAAAAENESGCSRLNMSEAEGFPVGEFQYRPAMCRSKKPLLETIREEPVYSR